MGIGKPSFKDRLKAIVHCKSSKKIVLISGLALVLIVAAVFGTGTMSRSSTLPSGSSDSSDIAQYAGSTSKISADTSATSSSTVSDTTAASAISSSGKYKVNSKIAAPFQSIAEELLATCNFPVLLPTYLPQPTVDAWAISPEIKSDSFSVDIIQGDPQSYGMAGYFGSLSENIGEPPSEQPMEKEFVDGGITPKTVHLPNGITGKEYVQAADMVGGTAITWKSGNWSFFVEANADDDPDCSAIGYAEQIIKEIENSGQSLLGSQGKFYFLQPGNSSATNIYWKTNNGIWYELGWDKDPIDAIRVAHSMVNVESK